MIYLMGTDGSGKTTLANSFVELYKSNGKEIKYLYIRHKPILLYPFKLLSRLLLYRRNSQFKNYEKYSEIKSSFSKNHPLLAKLYAMIWILDYILYYWIQVRFYYLFSKQIILDRYAADIVVNISVAIGIEDDQMHKLLNILHYFFPKPDISFFIEVDEDEAFRRKNDIPSVQYLRERKQKYFMLKQFYEFKILDGHLSPETLVEKLYEKVIESKNNG